MKDKINYMKLIISIVICQLAGIIGSMFTITSNNSWYANLIQPSFNPPGWLFGIVWTILYFLMGISLYIVWNNKTNLKIKKTVLLIFGIQLILNSLWPILFFGLKSPFFAFIEIIILWITILISIIYFYKISKISGYLLIPYILWVSFASILNFSYMILN